MSTFRALSLISRIQMAPLTMSVPVFGALSVNSGLTWYEGLGLGIVGLSAHIFGFGLNDIIDAPVDRKSPSRSYDPLVSGTLSAKVSVAFVIMQLPVMAMVYKLVLGASWAAMGVLCSSVVLSVVYNLFSKQGRLPRILAELSLAIAIGLLCICGVLSKTSTISVMTLTFTTTLTLILLLVNSVPSHLKDVKTDFESGVSSFVLSAGTTVIGDQIEISRRLWLYSALVQFLISVGLIGCIFLSSTNWLYISFALVFMIFATLHLRMVLNLSSFQQMRQSMPILSGVYNYFALSMFVASAFSMLWSIIFWGLVGLLLAIPLTLALRIWRNPYQLAG